MGNQTSRRDVLKGSLALAGLGVLGLPEWALPALAQGETLVPFTDWPENFARRPRPIGGCSTSARSTARSRRADQFFTTQHYGHPVVDPATFRLKVTGLVDKPVALARRTPQDGQHRTHRRLRMLGQPASAAGPIRQRPLDRRPAAHGARARRPEGESARDRLLRRRHGPEEVEFRTQKFQVEQQYGRSLTREKALSAEPFLAYALNGEPLTRHQGSPLRLIVPGWYGAPNVKWLAQIHAQEDQYLGKFQARWYRTLKGETIDGEMKWIETAITHMQLSRSSRASPRTAASTRCWASCSTTARRSSRSR